MRLLTEDLISNGITYGEQYLIYGECGAVLNEMVISESTTDTGYKLVRFRGKFQEADAINKNKRSYPFGILDGNVKKLQEAIKSGGLVGELDHPTDSIVHFANVSHKITKLWWEGKSLMGEGEILPTPYGKILKGLIDSGVRVGISSRGVGNGSVNEEGVLVIGEGYKLITFDAVADPSTYAAFQEKVVSPKRESVITPGYNENLSVKNEPSSIYKNKQLLKACLSGIVSEQTRKIKTR